MLLGNNKQKRVKFVSYTGEYPNLCSGVLTLDIDGVQYKFGHNFMCGKFDGDKLVYTDEDPDHPNFDIFWTSGGSVTSDNDWNFGIHTAGWIINVDELPEQFWDVADEIDAVINDNVPYGCCGGCI